VTVSDLEGALGPGGIPAEPGNHVLARDVASTNLLVARLGQPMAEALAQPGAGAVRQLPVVEGSGTRMRPVGLLRRTDVLSAYMKARDRQATLARRQNAQASRDESDLVSIDFSIREHGSHAGRSLSQLALPQDAIVTSIIRRGRPIVPRGAVVLQAGDQLRITTIVGSRDEVLSRLSGEAVRDQES
jgi:hypothetical protein